MIYLFFLILQFKEFLASVQGNFDMCVFDHVYAIATWENYAKNVNMLNCMFNDCAARVCIRVCTNRRGKQGSEEQNDYILIIFGYCLSRPCVRLCSWESISNMEKRRTRSFAGRTLGTHMHLSSGNQNIKYSFFFFFPPILNENYKYSLWAL